METVDQDLTHGILLELHPCQRRKGDMPAIYRLKLALKSLLRAHGFRAGIWRPLAKGENVYRTLTPRPISKDSNVA